MRIPIFDMDEYNEEKQIREMLNKFETLMQKYFDFEDDEEKDSDIFSFKKGESIEQAKDDLRRARNIGDFKASSTIKTKKEKEARENFKKKMGFDPEKEDQDYSESATFYKYQPSASIKKNMKIAEKIDKILAADSIPKETMDDLIATKEVLDKNLTNNKIAKEKYNHSVDPEKEKYIHERIARHSVRPIRLQLKKDDVKEEKICTNKPTFIVTDGNKIFKNLKSFNVEYDKTIGTVFIEMDVIPHDEESNYPEYIPYLFVITKGKAYQPRVCQVFCNLRNVNTHYNHYNIDLPDIRSSNLTYEYEGAVGPKKGEYFSFPVEELNISNEELEKIISNLLAYEKDSSHGSLKRYIESFKKNKDEKSNSIAQIIALTALNKEYLN